VNLTNTERVDSFHGYERFCVEMEHLITDAVRRNHPRPWDEDNITHTILASLQTLSPKIQVHRHNRENINVLWDFFKLTGPAENHYGDIAFIVRMHQKDGQHTDGLGVIEAKKINAKRDEYTELLGARKSQLQKQVERLPYALVALYDHQEISGFQANVPYLDDAWWYPPFFHRLEQTSALCVPANVVLTSNRRNRTLYPLGIPLSFQLAWRFLRGFDLHYGDDNLSLFHRFVLANGGFKFIVIVAVSKGDFQPESPLQSNDLPGYERLGDLGRNE
jgi:hypothetical protein